MRNILINFSVKYHGDYYKIMNAIKTKEILGKDEVERTRQENIQAITCCDNNFPERLKQIMYPPLVLFYDGDISLLNQENCISFVGALTPSEYGLMATKKIIEDLAKTIKPVIVSPFDRGIGQYALKTALDNKLKVITILPGGKNYFNDKENFTLYNQIKNNGLILSEFYDDVNPSKDNYISRFRILAGLSKDLIIGEGQEKCGVESAISFALDQGKNIFAIPFPIIAPSYNNHLIEEGATPLFDVKDLENINF